MCYYCCYLAKDQSISFDAEHYFPANVKYQQARTCHLATFFRLLGITTFFVMLNMTIVLSQSSQIQQQRDQSSSKILQNSPQDFFGVNTVNDEDQHQAKYLANLPSKSSQSSAQSMSTIAPSKTKRLTYEKRLIRDLLNNYPTIYARPIRNVSEPMSVSLGLTFTQLFDLGSTGQKMQTNVWKTYIWQDMNLVWDPDDYGGLATVCLPADSIWTPDIVLYNYADERLKDWRDISAVIQNTGDVLYVPAIMQFSVCFLDITNFPYDSHQCSLTYRSWTYDHTKLVIAFKEGIPSMDMTSYVKSNEWKVFPLQAEKTTNDSFSLLTYTMIIQRKGGLYGYILILPCLLLSVATMVVFWIPPESPAKMILTVSIFSGLFLLLLLLAESIPGGGGTPKIGYYYCVNMVVISVTAVLATIVIHIYIRGDRRQALPPSLRRFFLEYLARLYCMAPRKATPLPGTAPPRYGPPSPGALLLPEQIFLTPHYHEEEFSKKLKLLKQRFHEFHRQQQQQQQQQGLSSESSYTNDTMSALSLNLRSIENDLKEVRDYLRHMRKKIENGDQRDRNANDWKQVALVIDRTLFFAYCFWFVISLVVMFPKSVDLPQHWSIPNATSLTNTTIAANNLTLL